MENDDTLTTTKLLPRLRANVNRLLHVDGVRHRRLWAYYRNSMRVSAVDANDLGSNRPYRQAQEWGLPSRITGVRSSSDVTNPQSVDGQARKEVVIENDIAWRIDTMVDSLFGKPLTISSAAPDPERRKVLSELLRLIFAQNGGISFLQQMALLGGVHGFVDVLVKYDTNASDQDATSVTSDLGRTPLDGDAPQTETSTENLSALAKRIRLELVEPARALPVLSATDLRVVDAYAQVYRSPGRGARPSRTYKTRWIDRVKRSAVGLLGARDPEPMIATGDDVLVVELLIADRWMRFEDERLVASGNNSLGTIPLVHIQNVAEAFSYAGASDVEPLIPLQDELNVRLSDRANRITMQSFKMYLGKNIEGFGTMPVAPGRMWSTEDPQADIVEFGGDSSCPSEDAHIADVREAMDKTSGVTPIAAGAIKGRIGRLTSAAALRVTLQALLNRTEKKRTTYGAAIERMCELSLTWLDTAGVFRTTPEERRVELNWPSPIPQNQSELLEQAEAKLRVGVPREVVLRELGY